MCRQVGRVLGGGWLKRSGLALACALGVGFLPTVTASADVSCSNDPYQDPQTHSDQTFYFDSFNHWVEIQLRYSPVCREAWAVARENYWLGTGDMPAWIYVQNVDTGAESAPSYLIASTMTYGQAPRVVTTAVDDAATPSQPSQSRACITVTTNPTDCTGSY